MKIRKTRSICPTCLKEIPADIINHNDKIYIEKKCKNHGKFKAIHYFDNPLVYESMHNIIKDSETGNPDGMVIDITLNCNMGCPFCFAKTDRRTMDEPSIDTILSKIKGFKGSSIYLCGGEPTTREDLEEIISKIKEKGKNIVLFTNGLKLADKEYLKRLRERGLDLVILSFSSFDRHQSRKIYGKDIITDKLSAIKNITEMNIPLYLMAIVKKKTIEKQINEMIDFLKRNKTSVRVLNFQVLWYPDGKGTENEVTTHKILQYLTSNYGLTVDDFIQSTIFSHRFFEILRKTTGYGGRRSPRCEIRCYTWINNGEIIPISKIINISELNKKLTKINNQMSRQKRGKLWILMKNFPVIFLLTEFIKNQKLRLFIIGKIPFLFFDMINNRALAFSQTRGLLSIMLGNYHTIENVDLDFIKTCTLYASDNDMHEESFCMREIKRTCKEVK